MAPILRKGDLLCRWSWRWLFGRCRRSEQIRSCLLSAVKFHGGHHGRNGFCKQLVAIDSHRTMPPARQAHVECGLLNVRVVVATRRPERGRHAFVTGGRCGRRYSQGIDKAKDTWFMMEFPRLKIRYDRAIRGGLSWHLDVVENRH